MIKYYNKLSPRKKLFFENFFIYGFARIASKIVPIVALPIVTRLVPDTSIFGAFDLLNTIVSFGTAIAILGMHDSMFRLFFESEDSNYRQQICSTAFFMTLSSGVILFLLIVLTRNYISDILFSSVSYSPYIILVGSEVFFGAVLSPVATPTRMQNKRKIIIMMSLFVPAVTYSFSIPIIIFVDPLFGLICGTLASNICSIIIYFTLNKKWFSFNYFQPKMIYPLFYIGLPLVPTFLIYWAYRTADRLMINKLIGIEYNGIYAVGARVASVSQFIYTAFAGGWSYFAFSTMKDGDQVRMLSKIFERLLFVSIFSTGLAVLSAQYIFRLFFKGGYEDGYVVSPYLFLAPLLLMLFQTLGTQFLIIKKTWVVTLTLLLGALSNIALNYYLIPVLKIEGAGISTLFGYMLSVFIIAVVALKVGLLKVSGRVVIFLCMFLISWVLLRVQGLQQYYLLPVTVCCFACLYYKDICTYVQRFLR